MHIIFGNEQADALREKYTVLELDTFQMGKEGPIVTAFCAVEKLSLEDLLQTEQMKTLHNHLMINYRLRAWLRCQETLEKLKGFWGGEIDSFYEDLSQRITQYIETEPPADWSNVIIKG